jgi:flavin reductase (DIM6/NTAB) family NADH-FMN oxidoreductase RutF
LLHGALANFECRVHEKINAGDHVLFIGAVDAAHYCSEQRQPLIYFRGAYSNLQVAGDA